jgi:hypothetical protein
MHSARCRKLFLRMTNCFGVLLHPDDVRWAAAEGVSETVIAAVLLLHERSVEQIVAELSAIEVEQVIKLVGRSPRVYPPGTLDALKQRRTSISLQPPSDRGGNDLATKEPDWRTTGAQGRDTGLLPGIGASSHSPQSINGTGSPQMDRPAARISHEAEHQRRLAMLRARTQQSDPERSLREISRELAAAGYLNEHGRPFAPNSIRNMLAEPRPERISDDGQEEAT